MHRPQLDADRAYCDATTPDARVVRVPITAKERAGDLGRHIAALTAFGEWAAQSPAEWHAVANARMHARTQVRAQIESNRRFLASTLNSATARTPLRSSTHGLPLCEASLTQDEIPRPPPTAHKLVAESFALRNHDAVARNQLEKTSSFRRGRRCAQGARGRRRAWTGAVRYRILPALAFRHARVVGALAIAQRCTGARSGEPNFYS